MAVVECAVPRSFLRNSPTFAHIETFAVMSAKQALANGRLVRSICHLKSMDKAQARLGNVPNTNSLRIFSFLLLNFFSLFQCVNELNKIYVITISHISSCLTSSFSEFLAFASWSSQKHFKDVLSHSKFNGNCMPLKTIVSPISILLNAVLQWLMLESLQQIYSTMGIHLYQLHHHWVTSWRTPQNLRPS